jgi:Ca-activated chloride channel family protein
MNAKLNTLALTIGAALALTGCGDEGGSSDGGASAPPGATGVTQGGAQDFGLFRQILENGGVPGPDTIDDVGFFAEHKLDYPAPTCGEDLCVHGLVGAMGNMLNGASCTLIQVGMNTPLDADTLGRPPMHLVLSVDVSGSMNGAPINYLRAGLIEMADELQPEDHISLVKYSTDATVVLEHIPATDKSTLVAAFDALSAGGSTNLYDGLFTAYQLADEYQNPLNQNRVIFLSDGLATTGLQSSTKLRALAEGYAKQGIALSSIGVGTSFDVDVMRQLGEVGAGNFYFLEDPKAVAEVFTEEVKTFLHPIALDAQLSVSVASAYQLRAAYGTSGWSSYGTGGSVSIPSLFLAGRTSSDAPIEGGRRGGGGGLLLELVPRNDLDGSEPVDVGGLNLTWTHPLTGEEKSQTIDIATPHLPGEAPSKGWFSDKTVEKGFVMLNIYAAFKIATQLAADADPRTARRTLETLAPNVTQWLDTTPDPDIEDDMRYVRMFIDNLTTAIANSPVYEPADPPNPWPAD